MKKFCGYLFVSGLMLGNLLLQYDPASAWNDTMIHHGNGSGTVSRNCASHMANPTNVTPNSVTFKNM